MFLFGWLLARLIDLLFGKPERFDYVSRTRPYDDTDTTKRGW